ncbi:hypothetical protein [Hymenobacter actinosclerus]|uniref:hypothetical protein n=1 Tax=Hymenobacter actinosclerus TaxID=82805 RepID=UPI0011605D9E|nr:hypothetical protein [Hymenobacter actinosclerus]
MKKVLLSLFAAAILTGSSLAAPISPSENLNTSEIGGIDDGWYEATVKYRNPSTWTMSTYRLNVKVRYGRVVAIDFGNGGSIHTGMNNEGYIFGGGDIYTDSYGNTTSSVRLTQGSRMVIYEITF